MISLAEPCAMIRVNIDLRGPRPFGPVTCNFKCVHAVIVDERRISYCFFGAEICRHFRGHHRRDPFAYKWF